MNPVSRRLNLFRTLKRPSGARGIPVRRTSPTSLWASFAVALVCAVVCGCTHVAGRLPTPAKPHPGGVFQAGAARRDITPMPGFSTNGHSIEGRVARGWWTRLYARAIYVEDKMGRALALVSCDLAFVPAGLRDRVAELVARERRTAHLGRDQIVLGATHTHHGPGNYMTSPFYTAFSSAEPGFHPEWFEHLAGEIARAIVESARSREPAHVFHAETRVRGLSRNRSFEAFIQNVEAPGILAENADLPSREHLPEYPSPLVGKAVDPRLSVLRIERAHHPGGVIALAAFASLHNTAMPHEAAVYSSDLFGVAATFVEQRLRAGERGSGAPVVAIFNGAEGDISPQWSNQGMDDTLRLGRLLGTNVWALRRAGTDVTGGVDFRCEEFSLSARTFTHGGKRLRTARHPLIGRPMMAGAEDGRSVFHRLGFREGATAVFGGDQHPKLAALDPHVHGLPLLPISLTRLAMSAAPPPKRIPIGLYRVGDVTIASLPAEATLVTGRRLAAAIRPSLPAPRGPLLFMGLSNEYVQYVTTPEEYLAQHYEGASTLYGSNTGPLLETEFAGLARAFRETQRLPGPRTYSYRAGLVRRFGLDWFGAPGRIDDATLAGELLHLGVARDIRELPGMVWRDVMPRFGTESRLTPRVVVEQRTADGAWAPLVIDGIEESDEGLRFLVFGARNAGGGSKWRALWLPPRGLHGIFRMRAETLRGSAEVGEPFTLGDSHRNRSSQTGNTDRASATHTAADFR